MGRKSQSNKQSRPRHSTLASSTRTWIFVGVAIVAIIIYIMTRSPGAGLPEATPDHTATEVPSPDFSESQSFVRQGDLTFTSPDGTVRSKIEIEIADTEPMRQRGLMYRQQLGEDQGMLFIFQTSEKQTFWMKNTPLSLDMVFVNSYHEIVSISKETTPFAETIYASEGPAQYVVEVNAGYCDRHSVKVGDRVDWTTDRAR